MLQSSHKYLIAYDKKKQQNRYADFVINSLKVSFNDSNDVFVPVKSQDVKRCEKCKAVLHIRDKEWLFSIVDYKKLFESFHKDVRIPEYQGNNKNNDRDDRVWICRYCGKHQKLNIKNVFYMQKPLVIKQQEKKQANVKDPIIIFLIDLSGTMGNSATQNQVPIKGSDKSQKDEEHMKKPLYQFINSSELAKEAKRAEEQILKKQMKKILQKYSQKIQYSKTINKSHLLMALIQKAIMQMKIKIKDKNQKVKRKYGFIFFNNKIFLTGDCTKSKFPIAVATQKQKQDVKNNIDFTSFDELYKFGNTNSELFNNNQLQKFDSKNITLKNLKQDGQTALGPAIATALGIIENHGEGSTIIAITDGYANKGILSEQIKQQQRNQDISKISSKLKQLKCKLGIIQWRKKGEMLSQKNEIDKLIQSTNLAIKYEANLTIGQNNLQQYIRSIISLAFQGRIDIQITKLDFKHSVDFINVEHLSENKQQSKQFSKNQLSTLINSKSSIWMKVNIEQQKLDKFYLNTQPIYTQLITTVNKVDTLQIVQYVSQIEHYLTDNIKMTTSNGLNAINAEERIARYGIQGNSLMFNQQAMRSVNNSIYNYNISRGGYSIGVMNQDSKLCFARENGMSLKSPQDN